MSGDSESGGPSVVFEITTGVGVRMMPLRGEKIDIGRAADNTIILDDPLVSRKHARLDSFGSGWRVWDLRSRNGTFVNGVKAGPRPVAFRAGDELQIGSATIRVRAVDPEPSESDTVLQGSGSDPSVQVLTPREKVVLRLVAEGRTDAEIASTLSISIKTVHSHLDSIRDKTGARRRPDLTRLALNLGLIE